MSLQRFTPMVATSAQGVQCPAHRRCPVSSPSMASRQFCTFTSSNATRGPVVTDPQPKLLQLHPSGAPSTPEKPKRKYTARGTSGTFGGPQRPPKAVRLQAASGSQGKKTQKSNSYADRTYHKFVQEMLPLETSGSSRERFLRVVQKWQWIKRLEMREGQSAAMADEAMARAADNQFVM